MLCSYTLFTNIPYNEPTQNPNMNADRISSDICTTFITTYGNLTTSLRIYLMSVNPISSAKGIEPFMTPSVHTNHNSFILNLHHSICLTHTSVCNYAYNTECYHCRHTY